MKQESALGLLCRLSLQVIDLTARLEAAETTIAALVAAKRPRRPQVAPGARLALAFICERVSAAHGVSTAQIKGRRRTRGVYMARQDVAKQARAQGYTLEEIGRFLNRDHTTVMNMLRDDK